MLKTKASFNYSFSQWLKDVHEDDRKHFKVLKDEVVFCNVCNKRFNCSQKSLLSQHTSTRIHRENRHLKTRQCTFNDLPESNGFAGDLCEALLAADIPFDKLHHPVLKGFLEKHMGRVLPSVSTLRSRGVKENYDKVIETIRNDLRNKFIWMAVDETTDKRGRFVANVLVGNLDGGPTKARLLMSKELEKANNETIKLLVMDALTFLWPGKMQSEMTSQFLVFLSDAAPYMVKAAHNLKLVYPKLLHITCVAHAIHRVAESVRASFKDLDKLVGMLKAIFKKSPHRVRAYNKLYPGLSLPPEAVLTRWGTWITAVVFISEHFEKIKHVVMSFDPDEAECVKKAQDIFEQESIVNDLVSVSTNYAFLPALIQKLEEQNLTVVQVLKIISDCSKQLDSVLSPEGDKIRTKLGCVLKKNADLEIFKDAAKMFEGDRDVFINMDTAAIKALYYCPLTSVDVERSFSMEKCLLSSQRMSLTMENIEMYVVCHYNLLSKA